MTTNAGLSPLRGLAKLRQARTRRFSSYDRTGGNDDRLPIQPGETVTIAQRDGANDAWPPTLHGTGTEDYFNTAWCPTQDYSAPYHGIITSGGPNWSEPVTLYRWHIEDPVIFHKQICVTIEHGHANRRSDDISSVPSGTKASPISNFPACRRHPSASRSSAIRSGKWQGPRTNVGCRGSRHAGMQEFKIVLDSNNLVPFGHKSPSTSTEDGFN